MSSRIIIDSDYRTLTEALRGTDAPSEICSTLELIRVEYVSFDGKLHSGQVVIHEPLVADIRGAFDLMRTVGFPIERAVPVERFGWSDDLSMEANNSSGFNYRLINGTDRPSWHAFGRAFDINPRLNPCFEHGTDEYAIPVGATYDPCRPGTLTLNSEVVQYLEDRGWTWGGSWKVPKDLQHFQKRF